MKIGALQLTKQHGIGALLAVLLIAAIVVVLKVEERSQTMQVVELDEQDLQVEVIEQKPEQAINWPDIFPGGPLDDDGDGIDDRYMYRVSRDGRPVTDEWIYKIHPNVGKVAFPLDSRRGIYRGGHPPLVRNLPDFGPNMRWIHVPLGTWDDQHFVHYPGFRLKSGVQVAWVVVEDGSKVPIESPLLPETVKMAPRG